MSGVGHVEIIEADSVRSPTVREGKYRQDAGEPQAKMPALQLS